ncbi:MAG: leucine-rich repeat protein, partial [Prevotella sp.]
MITKITKIIIATILAIAMVSTIAIVVVDSTDSDATPITFTDCGLNYQVTSTNTANLTGTVKIIGYDSSYGVGETGLNLSATVFHSDITYNVTYIVKDVFKGCTSLYNVYIPSTMILDMYAFESCTSLKNVVFEDGPITLAQSIFNKCTGLESVDLPSTLTEIPDRLFNTCTSLTAIEIPSNVTKIGSYAFGYSGLTSLIIPDGVTEIGKEICFNCYYLEYVYMSGNLSVAGTGTFFGTSALQTIVSSSNSLIGLGISVSAYSMISGETGEKMYAWSKVSVDDVAPEVKEMLKVPTWTITYVDGTGIDMVLSASDEATVVVNSNGSTSVVYTVRSDVPTMDGCVFLGWAINGTIVTGSILLTSDVVITAMWLSYTVSFDSNGGSTASPGTIMAIFKSTYGTLATTSWDGYTFDGWFTAASGGTQITSATMVDITADATVYAQWTAIDYTVTYTVDGTIVDTFTALHIGDSVLASTYTVPAGYT